MNYFEKEGFERVLETDGFILARRGQKLAVYWAIHNSEMCMIKDMENGSGTWFPGMLSWRICFSPVTGS